MSGHSWLFQQLVSPDGMAQTELSDSTLGGPLPALTSGRRLLYRGAVGWAEWTPSRR